MTRRAPSEDGAEVSRAFRFERRDVATGRLDVAAWTRSKAVAHGLVDGRPTPCVAAGRDAFESGFRVCSPSRRARLRGDIRGARSGKPCGHFGRVSQATD